MAKPKIPNSSKAYNALHNRTERYVALLDQVYSSLNAEIAKKISLTSYDGSKPFKFSDYPETKATIERVQKQFAENVGAIVINGITAEWGEANLFNDKLANVLLKRYGADADNKRYQKYFLRNNEALNAFIARKDSNGFTISQKIWDISKDYKAGLEAAVSSGIEKGMSAVTLSKRISKYLKDYPKLRGDYRDKFGSVVNIKDCEYRSARLARTEINMAYRAAEHERWQQMDFVVGFEIKRSGRGYDCPMCEALAGKYPKGFKFVSWHPNCRCYMISILKTEEEFWDGDDTTTESVNEIKYMPANFNNWIKDNEQRIVNAKNVPYFVRDNSGIVPNLYIASSKRYSGLVDSKVDSICKEFGVVSTPINIKSDKRIHEKAISDYGGNVSEVMDIVRTTIITDESKLEAVIQRINEDFNVSRYKKQDFSKTNGYTGHLFNIKTSNATFAEIQVNTPEMIYAKEVNAKMILGEKLFNEIENRSGLPHGLGHKYYEEIRVLDRVVDGKKIERLNKKSRDYYNRIKKSKNQKIN